MKLFQRILIASLVLILTGCEDVIRVDLDTAAPRLVIDASIDWIKDTPGNEQKVLLSTSTGYYNETFPTVSGATVFVTNSSNVIFDFPESSTLGQYVCNNFIPVIDETYTLTVILNGETYTAVETLVGVPEINPTITQSNSGGFAGDELEIRYTYQDDGSQINYYMDCITSSYVAFPEYSLESDESYQGNEIAEFYSHEDLDHGDELNIKLYGVSRRFYDYFKKILVATGDSNGPFPPTPTAVKGNIINQTNKANYSLGYFRLSEVSMRNYTMQ